MFMFVSSMFCNLALALFHSCYNLSVILRDLFKVMTLFLARDWITWWTKSVLTITHFLYVTLSLGTNEWIDCIKSASSCDFFIVNRISFYQMSRDQHAYKHADCIAKVATQHRLGFYSGWLMQNLGTCSSFIGWPHI